MSDLKYKIILSVIGFATVVVAVVGVTFAYFVSNSTAKGSGGSLNAVTTKLGEIDFGEEGESFVTATDIEPGWKEEKIITVSSTASDLGQVIDIVLKYTNTMPDLTLKVEQIDENGSDNVVVTTDNIGVHEEETTLNLVNITFPKSETDITYKFRVTLELPDTDENQNDNQGKTFEATVAAVYNKIVEE